MGRRFTGWAAVLVAVGVATQPATARERKSAASRERESLAEMMAEREARSAAARQDASNTSAARATASAATLDSRARNRNGNPTAPVAELQPRETNPLKLKFGAVTLQPAVGGIKGARFSIGF